MGLWTAYTAARSAYDKAREEIDEAKDFITETEKRRSELVKSLGREGDYERYAETDPQRATASEIVRQGREFLDPESETYQGTYRRLTEPAEEAIQEGVTYASRALAADVRAADAEQIRVGDMRGAGRNPVAERQLTSRLRERAGFEHAQIQTRGAQNVAEIRAQASEWMEQYSRAFAADSVRFANEFADMQPYMREAYVNGVLGTFEARANTFVNEAAMEREFAGLYANVREMRNARRQEKTMGIISGVLTIASIGLGGWLGGGVGATLGATIAAPAAGATDFISPSAAGTVRGSMERAAAMQNTGRRITVSPDTNLRT